MSRLQLRGLMTIPEPAEGFDAQRLPHAAAKALFDRVRASGCVDTALFDTLSIGMTSDLEAAVDAGSTMVRVGTAIFGRRG